MAVNSAEACGRRTQPFLCLVDSLSRSSRFLISADSPKQDFDRKEEEEKEQPYDRANSFEGSVAEETFPYQIAILPIPHYSAALSSTRNLSFTGLSNSRFCPSVVLVCPHR